MSNPDPSTDSSSDPGPSSPGPSSPGPSSPGPAPREPIFNAPPGIIWLCVFLVLVHAASSLLGGGIEQWFFRRFAFSPVYFWSLIGSGQYSVSPWSGFTLLTHAFLHGDWMHLFINSGMLLAFGALVERIFGLKAMLGVFALGAVSGAVLQSLAEGDSPIAMVGASAAVYAMMGVVVQLMLASGKSLVAQRGLLLAVVLLALNLATGIAGFGDFLGGAQIAWQAHIGGFALGFLAFWPLRAWKRCAQRQRRG